MRVLNKREYLAYLCIRKYRLLSGRDFSLPWAPPLIQLSVADIENIRQRYVKCLGINE